MGTGLCILFIGWIEKVLVTNVTKCNEKSSEVSHCTRAIQIVVDFQRLVMNSASLVIRNPTPGVG